MQQFLGEYLFDTNCFYAISRKQDKIQDKVKAIKQSGFKITTAEVGVTEIATIVKEKDFQKRRGAMYALDLLVDDIYIAPDYATIPRAFGQNYDRNKDNNYLRELIRMFLDSKSPNDFDKTVNGILKKRKSNWQKYFPDAFRQVSLDTFDSENEMIRQQIVGFAYHAGLFSLDTYEKAKENSQSFDSLTEFAVANYNGDLDVLFKFVIKMLSNTKRGNKVEQNRVFDLEFLFHMRPSDLLQIFVTNEKDLIKIFQQVDKNRVCHFDEVLQKNYKN